MNCIPYEDNPYSQQGGLIPALQEQIGVFLDQETPKVQENLSKSDHETEIAVLEKYKTIFSTYHWEPNDKVHTNIKTVIDSKIEVHRKWISINNLFFRQCAVYALAPVVLVASAVTATFLLTFGCVEGFLGVLFGGAALGASVLSYLDLKENSLKNEILSWEARANGAVEILKGVKNSKTKTIVAPNNIIEEPDLQPIYKRKEQEDPLNLEPIYLSTLR